MKNQQAKDREEFDSDSWDMGYAAGLEAPLGEKEKAIEAKCQQERQSILKGLKKLGKEAKGTFPVGFWAEVEELLGGKG
jgi:hypothetical protein